ncbi:MAG: cobalamin biosynthesis protein [Candidatus Accumulibacter appositus]|uniref:Cobalamin biosynthesis protein CobD n=1 Tax=Candidatus Accumulibacter appositus TaxID=1454003 RepID=A0A011QFM0_9PROT|nr:adenosylcobinamide-phosphate synthase CbiB [Accumulibacter sp.]EXI77614.1 MAG: cobalamin biosynthesis protein [Candidatus Accumulibacter appositus]HRF03930.1 adenosylcobinamide-phosphate synthase CbiB [Accumulibacter sp.]
MPTVSSSAFLAIQMPPALFLPLAALAGAGLDRLLGEPRRWHPLVGFGALATAAESCLNRARGRRLRGLLAWCLLVLPFFALALWLMPEGLPGWVLHVLLLYLALGGCSLGEHARRVADDLASGDLALARQHVGWMVSRQTDDLDPAGVASACLESTLENGNDAIFGALFWFALLGGPGALLFRLANTLDAMWGYRNPRFADFGWAAARVDDLLNFVPARLTALSYALCGHTRGALRCWREQAASWKSPNAGPVMAAGAGSLGVALGGPARYHGRLEPRPPLGEGRPAGAGDIAQALALLRRSVMLWLALLVCWGLARA